MQPTGKSASRRYPLLAALRHRQAQQLFRYGIVAALATVVESVIFGFIRSQLLDSLVISKLLSYCSGIWVQFWLTRRFVFTAKGSGGMRAQFVRFLGVAAVVLVANLLVIRGLTAWAEATPFADRATPFVFHTVISGVAAVAVGFGSFTVNRLYTFR